METHTNCTFFIEYVILLHKSLKIEMNRRRGAGENKKEHMEVMRHSNCSAHPPRADPGSRETFL